jgi:galactoside O-acetyltransferase
VATLPVASGGVTEPSDPRRVVMNSGELYVDFGAGNEDLEQARTDGKELVHDYNLTRPSEINERARLLTALFGSLGANAWIEPPLHVAYGSHTHIGDEFYANFNLVLVDDAEVHIGDRVLIAPNVTISTAGHPVHPDVRRGGRQFSLPIRIGDDVWIGAQVVILPGVTIDNGSVIAAGAVVTRDVPAGVVAGGVPCRVLRPIGPDDETFVPPARRE